MSDRQLILEAVQEMPDTASFGEIMEELLLLDELKKRLAKNPHGHGLSAEALLGQVSAWATK